MELVYDANLGYNLGVRRFVSIQELIAELVRLSSPPNQAEDVQSGARSCWAED